MEQDPEPVGIELVGLMDVAHHGLGLGGMSQKRDTASGFDVIHNPIPITDGLQGDGGAGRELGEEGLDRPGLMVDPSPLDDLAVTIEDGEEGRVLAQP